MARGKGNSNQMASCPACGADIYFRKRPRLNQRVTCRQCSSMLEIVEVTPLELDWAFEDPLEDFDWEQYEDEIEVEDWQMHTDFEDGDMGGSDFEDTGNGRQAKRMQP